MATKRRPTPSVRKKVSRTPKATTKKKPTPRAASARARVAKARAPARPKQAEVGAREAHAGRPEQRPAFIPDARHARDALAEELGEGFVLGVTSGEDSEEFYERELPEEEGGPFLETAGSTEFAQGTDESNPEDAEPAPWPAVSPGQPPPHRPGGPR